MNRSLVIEPTRFVIGAAHAETPGGDGDHRHVDGGRWRDTLALGRGLTRRDRFDVLSPIASHAGT
jgi:hypothetical protein